MNFPEAPTPVPARPTGLFPLAFRSLDLPALVAVGHAPEPAAVSPELGLQRLESAAREAGLREGAARASAEAAGQIEQHRQRVVHALDEFLREKQRYFAGLEKEVVRLSLAIAERVLHREASMDPLLLSGAARVVLEQVGQQSGATLRVPPQECEQWRSMLGAVNRDVEITADASLAEGECLLVTTSGTMELGIRAQLQEIEHGFFQLLNRNPAMAV